ncbi:MAG: BtpA/SgcQ family protein [Bdellovibrionia bacterium]
MIRSHTGAAIPRLIGVIHLPPLAGSPRSLAEGDDPALALQKAGILAVKEAKLLAQAGFEGIILENFGDTPFFKTQVPPETIASLAIIAAAVRESVSIPIGINVLRNDSGAALAIAAVTSCDLIRVNVLTGVAATDQGMIEGEAAKLIRERQRLGSNQIGILADVHVKHARSLSSDDIGIALEEVALRSMADAVIVTGVTTGRSVEMDSLRRASEVARAHDIPVLIGSGARRDNLGSLLQYAQGIIVGSDLRRDGKAGAPLDPKRVREFAKAFMNATKSPKKTRSKPTKKVTKKRK